MSNELEALEAAGSAMMFTNLATFIFSIVTYVLTALALYSFAKRRGIAHAWLSWIPIGDLWILGSLADQYRYVAKGEVKNKRKALLILSIIMAVVMVLIIGLTVGVVVQIVLAEVGNYTEDQLFEAIFGPLMGLMISMLPLLGISIAVMIIQYMALYDLYRSCAPENAMLFLLLSIFFNITTAFFLFFNREKDAGMVRQQPPFYQPPTYLNGPGNGGSWQQPQNPQGGWNQNQNALEPWDQNRTDQDPWNQPQNPDSQQ